MSQSPDLLAPLPLRAPSSGVASDCRLVPFDHTDRHWAEPMVDLAEQGLLSEAWYARSDGGNAPYHRRIAGAITTVAARAGVVALLEAADAAVAPRGLRIKTVDAWRPVETQAGLWDFFWEKI